MDVAGLRRIFAERIKELRTELGLNQGEFADKVGVSRGAMSYYEQEARTPDLNVLHSICEKCGVSADYMIGLIPDRDRAVSDVCLETDLLPKAVKTLQLIKRIKDSTEWGEVAEEAVGIVPFTSATTMANLLLCTDEGLHILNLLGGIIAGAELETGSDQPPVFKMITGNSRLRIEYPLQNINAALLVNIQNFAEKLREKIGGAE